MIKLTTGKTGIKICFRKKYYIIMCVHTYKGIKEKYIYY